MSVPPGRPEGEAAELLAPPAGQWKIIHGVAAFVTGIAASLVAALPVLSGGITSFEAFAVLGSAQSLATIAVVAALKRFSRPALEDLGFRFTFSDAWGLPAGALLQIVLSLLLSVVVVVFFSGEAPVQDVVQVVDEAAGLGTRMAVVITAVLLAPVAEEIVFRGVLLRALAHRLPRWAAAVGSAGAFALGHLLDPNAGLAVPALFVAGLVLAWQVLKSGRLGGAIAMHVGFNLLSVLLLFFT